MSGTRLYKTVSATTPIITPVSPLTFTYQPIPMGSVWTGTIQVLQSPTYAFHQCTIGGVLWAEWLGFQPSPVIQAMTGEVITVTSTGLTPGTLYQATLIGRSDPSDNYNPVWPEASANSNFSATSIAEQVFTISGGPLNATIQAGQNALPGSVLAIQFASSGGTCNGLKIVASNGTGNRFTTMYPQNSGLLQPWWFIPIQDLTVTLTIYPVLNNVAGGTVAGALRTVVLPGPLYIPVLQSGWDIAPGGAGPNNISQQVAGVAVTAATTTILSEPPTGSIYLIRALSMTSGPGPGATNNVIIQGTASGLGYRRFVIPTGPTSIQDDVEYYLGSANRFDPAEGLAINNACNVNFNVTITYDILPFPQGIPVA